MGFYVKGMEMPKDGYRQVFIDSNGTVTWFNNGADGPNTMYKAKAFPVQPHGRLIDADALEQDAQSRLQMCNKYDNQFQKPYEVMRAIALAPTVIPAEPPKEETWQTV